MQAWEEAVDGALEKRLRWDGLDEGAARRALFADDPSNPQEIGWLALLEAMLVSLRDQPIVFDRAPPAESTGDKAGGRPFEELWQRVARWSRESLVARLPAESLTLVSTQALDDLEDSLVERLVVVGQESLLGLFNRDRSAATMLLAHVGTEGPSRERYRAFLSRCAADGLSEVLAEFPVLGRLLAIVIGLWQEAAAELLARVARDRQALEQRFGISSLLPLARLWQNLSDPHRGGRSVAILAFGEADTPLQKVVYKPKDLRVDAAFQHALSRLPVDPLEVPLRSLEVLVRDGYGYMEVVEHRTCVTEEELSRFYSNAGRLTAVLHILGCTDCHYDNLIACGDQLVLIDTETLFEPDIADHVSAADDRPRAASDLGTRIARSVLRSGMLPQWVIMGKTGMAMDISALGIEPPAEARSLRPGWIGVNTDGMMRSRVWAESEVPSSLPVGIGGKNRLSDLLDPFCSGFRRQLEQLMGARAEWLEPGGLLDSFSGLPRRLIVRGTRVYVGVQHQQLKPKALRSSAAQGLTLEILARSFLLAEHCPRHWPLFAAELRAMEQLDVPFFEHAIDGEDLPLPFGLAPIRAFMTGSGLAASRLRLEQLDADEIDLQVRLIRGVVTSRVVRNERAVTDASLPLTLSPLGVDVRRRQAEALVAELQEKAMRSEDGRLEWLGMDLVGDADKLCFGPVGISLYSGCIGIALPFFALGEEHRPTARSALSGVLGLVAENTPADLVRWLRDQQLGFAGVGGVLLGLELCGRFDPERRDEYDRARSLLTGAMTPERLVADVQHDILFGVAGLIGPLLRDASDRAMSLAIAAGDHLLSVQTADGSWVKRQLAGLGLTGFSHGAAGMAAALGVLHRETGLSRFEDGARRALAYERRWFDREKQNWRDLRGGAESKVCMNSWCHGAAGIALGRLCLLGTDLRDAELDRELEVGLATTATDDIPLDNLCCGRFGRSAILRVAAAKTETSERWLEASRHLEAFAAHGAAQTGRYQLLSTRESSLVDPGLFTGLAGIGLGLLGSADLTAILSAGLLKGLADQR